MVLSLVAAATATAAQPHEVAVLLECPYDLTSLAYSPDGSMVVAAASSSPAMRQQNAAKQGDGIVVFTGDGAGWRKVLTAAPTQQWLGPYRWSPDGTHILCGYTDEDFAHADEHGYAGYGVVDIATGNARSGSYKRHAEWPMWVSDRGHGFVLASREPSEGSLRAADESEGNRAAGPFIVERWERRNEKRQLMRYKRLWVRRPDGARGKLVMGEDKFGGLVLSPTRAHAAVTSLDGSVSLVQADGGPVALISVASLRESGSRRIVSGAWRPDGAVYLIVTGPASGATDAGPNRVWAVRVCPDDTGE